MIGNNSVRLTGSKRNLFAVLASSAVLTAGCSNMVSTAPQLSPNTSSATIGGRIHGGNQPVGGAAVTLYYAGQNGNGSGDSTATAGNGAPIVAASTTSANDGTGSFSFSKSATNGDTTVTGNQFSCPTSGDPVVYVVARGGNTLNTGDPGVSNTAAAFIGVYGLCSQIGPGNFLYLSEATTVATMAAVQQYFNPVTESIGADGIGAAKAALVRTINTINTLADTTAGVSRASTQLSGAGSVSITATPESAKLNLIANIISACVNNATSSAQACSTLFANATPPSTAVTSRPYHAPAFSNATDVLQAVYYLFTNPTSGGSSNMQNVFNLAPAVGAPYQPTLSSVPSSWSVAVNYRSTSTCGAGSGDFINSPQDLNIDGSGNLWIANGQATSGNLVEISSAGVPVACVQSGGSNGGGVVDNAGNIWYTSASSSTIYRYKPNDQSVLTFTTPAPALALFADGATPSGNIYFTTAGSLYELPAAAGATTSNSITPVQISSLVGPNPVRMMIDINKNIWVTSGSNYISEVVAFASDPGNSNGYLNGFATYQFGAPNNTYGVSVFGNPATVYISSNGSNNSVTAFTGTGTNYSLAWTTTAGQAGLNNPSLITVDGRSSVWGLNRNSDSGTGLYALSGLTAVGASLTPDGTTSGGLQLAASYLNGGNASVIDMSGNLWLAGNGNSVTEIVGGTVPVYQPYSVGLQNGRFQTLP